jgi:hypothetical protein
VSEGAEVPNKPIVEPRTPPQSNAKSKTSVMCVCSRSTYDAGRSGASNGNEAKGSDKAGILLENNVLRQDTMSLI